MLSSFASSRRELCQLNFAPRTHKASRSPWRTNVARTLSHLLLPSTSLSQVRAPAWAKLPNRPVVPLISQQQAASPSSTKASLRLRSNSGSIMAREQPSMLTIRTQSLIYTLIWVLSLQSMEAIRSLQVSLPNPWMIPQQQSKRQVLSKLQSRKSWCENPYNIDRRFPKKFTKLTKFF